MDSVQILQNIEQNRDRLTKALLYFVQTDTILFAFNEDCQKKLTPFVAKANTILNSSFNITMELNPPNINQKQKNKLFSYLERLPLHKFATLYLTATETRSVLLGILLIENTINVDTLLQLAFFEELYQQKHWGQIEETTEKYFLIKNKITEFKKLQP